MKVYFTTTTAKFDKHKEDYLLIRKTLLDEGHVVTRDWIKNIINNPKNLEDQRNGSKSIYQATINALQVAQALIAEDTISNFSTGHLITLALQQKKPVLVLWKKDQKQNYLKSNFIEGIESDLLYIKEYDSENIRNIIRSFINSIQLIDERYRFNLVINKTEKDYLDWAQFNKKESRTKLIRKGINELMAEDKEYELYLKK